MSTTSEISMEEMEGCSGSLTEAVSPSTGAVTKMRKVSVDKGPEKLKDSMASVKNIMGWFMTTTMHDLIGKTFTVERKKAFSQKIMELERAITVMMNQCGVANAKLEESRYSNEKLIDRLCEIRKEKEMMEVRVMELEKGNTRTREEEDGDSSRMPPPNMVPSYSQAVRNRNREEGLKEKNDRVTERARSRSSKRNKIRKECKEQTPQVPFELNIGDGEAHNTKEELWMEVTKKVTVPKMTLLKKNDKLIITAKDEETLKALKDIATEDKRIKERSARWPKLMVKGVDKEIPGDQISRAIAFSNREIGVELVEAERNIKPLFRKGPRHMDTVNWVIEVAPGLSERIMKMGYVYIKWNRCKVQEFYDVSQCFKCLGFGHIMTKCRQEGFRCKHCAGTHDSWNCMTKENVKCYNCGQQHIATSDICITKERKIRDQLRRTDYGDRHGESTQLS
ncbi:uncharacterized protein LOC126900700 [Daktulosphaira vitifoliae]|uniref:uncharacterized protein LOC126900700 n=1 Tax=Daktulosphaira vitifoliae TaxID=58002 RepID=UPI0021AAF414|nr:uncharacterized protein LOC126900700 [Daktulosphaira vitifoliae]